MSELDTRLSAIFRAALPGLDEQNVRQSTRESVISWDSIAIVTLSSLIDEEFGVQFDLDDAAEWASYEQVRQALEKRLNG